MYIEREGGRREEEGEGEGVGEGEGEGEGEGGTKREIIFCEYPQMLPQMLAQICLTKSSRF